MLNSGLTLDDTLSPCIHAKLNKNNGCHTTNLHATESVTEARTDEERSRLAHGKLKCLYCMCAL